MTKPRAAGDIEAVIVEADGGSRGNPGTAGYGALVRDARTGEVLAERAAPLGIASNNVAEYSGLVAGLQAVLDLGLATDATVEVRMDSKLVVEQMSGRWKIKHPDMRPLALAASGRSIAWRWFLAAMAAFGLYALAGYWTLPSGIGALGVKGPGGDTSCAST